MLQCGSILSVPGEPHTALPTHLSVDGVPRGKVGLQEWGRPPSCPQTSGSALSLHDSGVGMRHLGVGKGQGV